MSLVGACSYIRNIPFYACKHRDAEVGGEHVMLSFDGNKARYTGFGLPQINSSIDEVYDFFTQEFNKMPIPLSDLVSPKYVAVREQFDKLDPNPPPAEIQEIAKTYVLEQGDIADSAETNPDKVGPMNISYYLSIDAIRKIIAD